MPAYVRRIEDISPIEGADKIEVARVRGWYSKKEGIVVRPCKAVSSPVLGAPLSFKVINPGYRD